MNTNHLPAVQTVRAFTPAGAPSASKRKPLTHHAIAANFHTAVGSTTATVHALSVARLVAMLDCEHGDGSNYVVVSKQVKSGQYVTTVLDVPLGKLYRAAHATGLVSFWKGVAARRAEAVTYLRPLEAYEPGGEGAGAGAYRGPVPEAYAPFPVADKPKAKACALVSAFEAAKGKLAAEVVA